MSEVTQDAKAFWQSHTERRKARAIRSKMIRFFAERHQTEAFYMLMDDWILRWGKEAATDLLIAAMADSEARYRDLKELIRARKKAKPNGDHS